MGDEWRPIHFNCLEAENENGLSSPMDIVLCLFACLLAYAFLSLRVLLGLTMNHLNHWGSLIANSKRSQLYSASGQ